MSKKRKKAAEPISSPVNFFKTRARSIPLHKCFISDNWQKTRLPTVVVSRRHLTGNVSACLYMVDLNCLGVVSTMYIFNVPEEEMIRSIDYYYENALIDAKYIDASYTLVHYIIYAGAEFAREWGIPVQNNFFVTREFLEPDDEEIELIEIECGDQEMPAFNSQMYEDFFPGKADAIIKKLDKYPGPGRYKLVSQYSSDDDANKEDKDVWDDDKLEDPDTNLQNEDGSAYNYTPEDFEKDKHFFLKNFNKDGSFDWDKFNKFEIVLDRLGDYLADNELVEQYNNTLFDLEFDEIAFDSLPEGFIDVNNASPELKQKVVDALFEYMADDRRPRQNIKKLEKLIGRDPLITYLTLSQDKLENVNDKTIEQKLRDAIIEFPDNTLLKLFHYNHLCEKSEDGLQLPDENMMLSNYFGDRSTIHLIELQAYVGFFINELFAQPNLEKLIAFDDFLNDLFIPKDIFIAFESLVLTAKIICIKKRLKG